MTKDNENISSDNEKQVNIILEEGYDEWLLHNGDKAITLFEEVLQSDPDNYKAIFYRLLSFAITNKESELNSFVFNFIPIAETELKKVVATMRSQNQSDKAFTEACVEFVVELSILCCGSLRLLDNFDKNVSFEPKGKTIIILNNFLIDILNILDNTDDVCDGFFEMMLQYMMLYKKDVDEMKDVLEISVKNYNECYLLVSKHCNSEIAPASLTSSKVFEFGDKANSLKKENEEIPTRIDELTNAIDKNIAETKKDFECEESKEKEKIINEINSLKSQKEKLTFFKFKEKKQLQQLIDEKTDCINSLDTTIAIKKRERDESLIIEAKNYHKKADSLLKKMKRNTALIHSMSNHAECWFSFNTIGYKVSREEE